MQDGDWASGLVVCTSGLTKAVRQGIAQHVEAAGGRYTPNLSRAVTHVLVDHTHLTITQKLSEIARDPKQWPQKVVDCEWLAACRRQSRLLDTGPYAIKLVAGGPNQSQGTTARPCVTWTLATTPAMHPLAAIHQSPPADVPSGVRHSPVTHQRIPPPQLPNNSVHMPAWVLQQSQHAEHGMSTITAPWHLPLDAWQEHPVKPSVARVPPTARLSTHDAPVPQGHTTNTQPLCIPAQPHQACTVNAPEKTAAWRLEQRTPPMGPLPDATWHGLRTADIPLLRGDGRHLASVCLPVPAVQDIAADVAVAAALPLPDDCHIPEQDDADHYGADDRRNFGLQPGDVQGDGIPWSIANYTINNSTGPNKTRKPSINHGHAPHNPPSNCLPPFSETLSSLPDGIFTLGMMTSSADSESYENSGNCSTGSQQANSLPLPAAALQPLLAAGTTPAVTEPAGTPPAVPTAATLPLPPHGLHMNATVSPLRPPPLLAQGVDTCPVQHPMAPAEQPHDGICDDMHAVVSMHGPASMAQPTQPNLACSQAAPIHAGSLVHKAAHSTTSEHCGISGGFLPVNTLVIKLTNVPVKEEEEEQQQQQQQQQQQSAPTPANGDVTHGILKHGSVPQDLILQVQPCSGEPSTYPPTWALPPPALDITPLHPAARHGMPLPPVSDPPSITSALQITTAIRSAQLWDVQHTTDVAIPTTTTTTPTPTPTAIPTAIEQVTMSKVPDQALSLSPPLLSAHHPLPTTKDPASGSKDSALLIQPHVQSHVQSPMQPHVQSSAQPHVQSHAQQAMHPLVQPHQQSLQHDNVMSIPALNVLCDASDLIHWETPPCPWFRQKSPSPACPHQHHHNVHQKSHTSQPDPDLNPPCEHPQTSPFRLPIDLVPVSPCSTPPISHLSSLSSSMLSSPPPDMLDLPGRCLAQHPSPTVPNSTAQPWVHALSNATSLAAKFLKHPTSNAAISALAPHPGKGDEGQGGLAVDWTHRLMQILETQPSPTQPNSSRLSPDDGDQQEDTSCHDQVSGSRRARQAGDGGGNAPHHLNGTSQQLLSSSLPMRLNAMINREDAVTPQRSVPATIAAAAIVARHSTRPTPTTARRSSSISGAVPATAPALPLQGQVLLLDPNLVARLDPECVEQLRQSLYDLGAGKLVARQEAGVSTVVCATDAGPEWVWKKRSVVSMDWVDSAARAVRAGKCTGAAVDLLRLSGDVVHRLQKAYKQPGAAGMVKGAAGCGSLAGSGVALLTNRKMRVSELARIKQQEQLAVQMTAECTAPVELLSDISWAVTQALPDSRSSVQAGSEEDEEDGHHVQYCDNFMNDVVWKGPDVLLLVPHDEQGILGHHPLQLDTPIAGLQVRHILEAVRSHYEQDMGPEEQLQLMQKGTSIRRVLQEPFLKGVTVPRSSLLGRRVAWDRLSRCGPDNDLPVYRLRLTM